MIIRHEEPSDVCEIRKIVEAAFPTPAEARLVEQLRSDGDAVISMVAVQSGIIVGHVMLSKMDAPFRALGLGPVAVAPDRQRKGIGGSLVRSALKEAEKEGWQGVFVLGDPNLYQKFGFDPALASGFTSPYAGPHLMALSFNRPLPVATGIIDYAPAFAALG
ncbi:GNAT family N-acetyltransferase [Methylocystis iwaonis]|uniref:GCN5 family N-acetyltransferase n=1 Tax=Methylocystis iwaonis TaxID=2885079 RepID=A0ABN6VHR5_9HYPH|nr:N-acetyltransferase [Methylocystis iwaonis]BDV34462.1 GCN5 family N-acetyltransferase [Methylocystis iwaonis]